jgi:hypothetical protein
MGRQVVSFGPRAIFVYQKDAHGVEHFTLDAFISPEKNVINISGSKAKQKDPEVEDTEQLEMVDTKNVDEDEVVTGRVRDRLRLLCDRVRNKIKMRHRTDLNPEQRIQVEASFQFRHLHALNNLYSRHVIPKMLNLKTEKQRLEESIAVADSPTRINGSSVSEEVIETLYSRLEMVTEDITKYSASSCIKWHAKLDRKVNLDHQFMNYVSAMIKSEPSVSQLVENIVKKRNA